MTEHPLSQSDKALIGRLLKDNFRKHASLYSKAIISMIFAAGATGATALVMKHIINALIGFKSLYNIFFVALAVAAIFFIKGVANYFQLLYLSKAGNSIIAEQQRKIYNHLVEQGISFFHENTASDLLLRITNNAQAARNIINTLVTTYIRDLISLITLVIVMIWTNYWLALIAATAGPLIFLTVQKLRKKIKNLTQKEMSSLSEIIQVVQETAIGIRVIKAFSLEKLMSERMNNAIADVEKRSNAISKLQAITSPLMETVAGMAIAFVISISGMVILHKNGTAGDLMAFITAVLLAYEPAKRLTNSRVQIESGMVGVRMMFQILDHPITLKENENAQDITIQKGNIHFENLTFGYNEEQPILQNLDLFIQGQKTTALVGPSGSGKTTLINLILRLYDPTHGRIIIDDQDIKQASFSSLRQQISYVGQDIFLFQGSIKNNIAIGKENASDAEIIAAAKNANAHDFILNLPHGYDTQIVDNGINLSGGQRQRLAIARAMLRDSKILLLDEATSALDAETEALIRQAIKRLTQGKTTLMIAHRFSSITSADHIIVMRDGSVIEQGSQKELLAQNGLYQKLYALQFKDPDQDFLSDTSVEILNKNAC